MTAGNLPSPSCERQQAVFINICCREHLWTSLLMIKLHVKSPGVMTETQGRRLYVVNGTAASRITSQRAT